MELLSNAMLSRMLLCPLSRRLISNQQMQRIAVGRMRSATFDSRRSARMASTVERPAVKPDY